MGSKRLRIVLQVLLATGILIFTAVLLSGLSTLSSKSNEVVNLKLKDKTAEAQLLSLASAKKDLQTYGYFKAIAKSVIPNDKDQAQAVLDIFQLATEAGISIQNVTFPTSSLGSSSSSTSGSSTQTNAQGASSKAVLSQAKPVTGIAGLYGIELTITPETGAQVPQQKQATYPKLLSFLKKLENNRRTAQITQVNIQPAGTETGPTGLINFSLTINIFIKP